MFVEILFGVNIPKCWICEKETAVLNADIVGGPFIKVCNRCLKHGKKIEFCEVDNEINHCELVEVVNIKKKK